MTTSNDWAENVAPIPSRRELRRKAKGRLNERSILKGANPEQASAIKHASGPLGVFAGAGSGKTRVLTCRMALLVANGADPEKILAVTFSKKAAMEMEQRVKALGVFSARVGTWHSLALQILREDGLLDGWAIDDKDRAKLILKTDVLGWKGMKWNDSDLGEVASFIGYCKSQIWLPEDEATKEHATSLFGARSKPYLEAYRLYEMELEDNRLITFDCMLLKAALHLRRDEDTRKAWSAKWDHVLQDEAQDANPVQLALAEMLSRDHQNYMLVGDPAQSIYGWRGSRPEYVMKFHEQWANATTVTMHRNYRCGSAIVEVANRAIAPAEMKLPEDLTAEGGWVGGVSWYSEADLDTEAEHVASIILTNVKNGSKHDDHTVLFRTNAQSRALEEAFLGHKIPYVVVGGTSFYERKEVKDLLCYLRTATDRDLVTSVRRCINAPFRYIGAKTLDKVVDAMKRLKCKAFNPDNGRAGVESVLQYVIDNERIQTRQAQSLYDWYDATDTVRKGAHTLQARADPDRKASLEFSIENAPDRSQIPHTAFMETVGDVIDWLERDIGYIKWLKKDQGDEGIDSSHVANVKELIRVASRFATVEEFLDFIDETKAKSEKAKREGAKGRVLLMSVHRSKGLEWPFVFVVGVSEGILPHPRGDIEEERRLFYVAVTRAAQHAYLFSPHTLALRNGVQEVDESRFITEVKDLCTGVSEV